MMKYCHFTVSCPHHQESMGAWPDERSHSSGIWYVVLMLINDLSPFRPLWNIRLTSLFGVGYTEPHIMFSPSIQFLIEILNSHT